MLEIGQEMWGMGKNLTLGFPHGILPVTDNLNEELCSAQLESRESPVAKHTQFLLRANNVRNSQSICESRQIKNRFRIFHIWRKLKTGIKQNFELGLCP